MEYTTRKSQGEEVWDEDAYSQQFSSIYNKELSLDGHIVNKLRYADDTVLVAKSEYMDKEEEEEEKKIPTLHYSSTNLKSNEIACLSERTMQDIHSLIKQLQ